MPTFDPRLISLRPAPQISPQSRNFLSSFQYFPPSRGERISRIFSQRPRNIHIDPRGSSRIIEDSINRTGYVALSLSRVFPPLPWTMVFYTTRRTKFVRRGRNRSFTRRVRSVAADSQRFPSCTRELDSRDVGIAVSRPAFPLIYAAGLLRELLANKARGWRRYCCRDVEACTGNTEYRPRVLSSGYACNFPPLSFSLAIGFFGLLIFSCPSPCLPP